MTCGRSSRAPSSRQQPVADRKGVDLVVHLPAEAGPAAARPAARRAGAHQPHRQRHQVHARGRPRGRRARARRPDGARLTVTDTGVGIPADEMPHVFERFWRGARRAGAACERLGPRPVHRAVDRGHARGHHQHHVQRGRGHARDRGPAADHPGLGCLGWRILTGGSPGMNPGVHAAIGPGRPCSWTQHGPRPRQAVDGEPASREGPSPCSRWMTPPPPSRHRAPMRPRWVERGRRRPSRPGTRRPGDGTALVRPGRRRATRPGGRLGHAAQGPLARTRCRIGSRRTLLGGGVVLALISAVLASVGTLGLLAAGG